MIKLIKLTTQNMTTYGGYKWKHGVTRAIPRKQRTKVHCSSGVLHAYKSVAQALLMNPVHSAFRSSLIHSAESPEIVLDPGDKVCVHELTLTSVEPYPSWWEDARTRQRVQVQFAVLCAEATLNLFEEADPDDRRPRRAIEAALKWLNGGSSTAAAAYAAAYAAAAAFSPLDLNALAEQAVLMIVSAQ